MDANLIIGAVVIIVLALCLLGWLIYKVGDKIADRASFVADRINTAGSYAHLLSLSVDRAAEHFAPVRNIRCTRCGGTGTVEKENPLWAAIAESLEANAAAARRRK